MTPGQLRLRDPHSGSAVKLKISSGPLKLDVGPKSGNPLY